MNRNLITPAIVFTALIIFGYFYFQYTVRENVPGENMNRMANKHLEDGKYDDSLRVFNEVLSKHPEYKEAYMGRGIVHMQIGEFEKAREDFDTALVMDDKYAAAYANRGILNDRVGNYLEAVADYRRAVELNPEIAEGPGLIWRFLRNVPEKPPTIVDRADYIEKELNKPEEERLLRVPEIDAQQRMYKK